MDKKLTGLLILSHFNGFGLSAEHDIIYSGVEASEVDTMVSILLDNLGFNVDEDTNMWIVYV